MPRLTRNLASNALGQVVDSEQQTISGLEGLEFEWKDVLRDIQDYGSLLKYTVPTNSRKI